MGKQNRSVRLCVYLFKRFGFVGIRHKRAFTAYIQVHEGTVVKRDNIVIYVFYIPMFLKKKILIHFSKPFPELTTRR